MSYGLVEEWVHFRRGWESPPDTRIFSDGLSATPTIAGTSTIAIETVVATSSRNKITVEVGHPHTGESIDADALDGIRGNGMKLCHGIRGYDL